MQTTAQERPAAVLVAVQLPDVSDTDHEADLAELGRLVHTLGYDVVATVSQRRSALAACAATTSLTVHPSGAPMSATITKSSIDLGIVTTDLGGNVDLGQSRQR